MFCSYQMLAAKFDCSESTIRRRVKEMETSGLFPGAVRRVCGVQVDDEQFEKYCTIGRRRTYGEIV